MDDWSYDRLKSALVGKLVAKHVSKAQAVTGKDLTDWFRRSGFPELDQRTLRIAIRELRRAGQPICSAAGLGYFWPAALEDVETCRAVEFDEKAKDMLYTGKAMFEGAIRMFGEQRSLGL